MRPRSIIAACAPKKNRSSAIALASRAAPSAAARRLDPDPIAGSRVEVGLGRKPRDAPPAHEEIRAPLRVAAAAQSPRREFAPVGQQAHVGIDQAFELAYQAVAAA